MARKTAQRSLGTLRGVAYIRVSTEEQARRETSEAQRHEIQQYAAAHGIELVAEFADEGVSGTVPFEGRTAGARIVEWAQERPRPFDLVIVRALDRLARDTLETLVAERLLKALGVEVRSVRQTFDDSPSGRFHMTVTAAVGELDRANILANMKAGRERSVRSGKYLASLPPYGYDRDRTTGLLSVNDTQADVVREMFRLTVDEDMGLQAIARRLDDMGIEPPLKRGHPNRRGEFGWSFGTVAKMLKARRYIGEGSYGDTPMACPPIIDEETFEAAQQALARRQSAALRTRSARDYWLTDFMLCRHCAGEDDSRSAKDRRRGKFVGFTQSPRKDGSRSSRYECQRARRHGVGKTGHAPKTWLVDADEVEARVAREVMQLYADPEAMAKRLDLQLELALEELRRAQPDVARAQEKLESLDVRQERVLIAWTRDQMTDSLKDRQLAEIEKEREAARATIDEAGARLDRIEQRRQYAQDFIAFAKSLPFGGIVREVASHSYVGTGEKRRRVDEPAYEDMPVAEQLRHMLAEIEATVWVEEDGTLTLTGSVCDSITVR